MGSGNVLDLYLEEDEVVEIKEEGKYRIEEITKKSWGMYLTPSINNNLKSNGMKIGILRVNDREFIISVNTSDMNDFMEYFKSVKADRIIWLSNA